MTYKLTYFNIKARGEPIRFLLSYGGLKFEDIRINMEEWFDLKPTITFGQLPLLELDGKVAHQSVAICRYLGKQVKLAGENDWENLEIDSAVDTLCDLRQKIKDYAFETRADIKESQRKQLFDETIPYYLKKFDEQAKKNGGYFAIGREMTYKLTYFDIAARAEPIRYLLSYGGLKYEDIRISEEKWSTVKPNMPFGQLPIFEYENKVAHQSVAICRYLGKQVHLVGENDWEDLEIDAVVDTLSDFRQKVKEYLYCNGEDAKKALGKQLFGEVIPYYLKRFDDMAKKNGGHIAVGRLTWADLFLVGNMDTINKFAETDIFADYTNLQQIKQNVLSIPSIKKCVENNPCTTDEMKSIY